MKLFWISMFVFLGLDIAALAAPSRVARSQTSSGKISRSVASESPVKKAQRRPASGGRACPEAGCACEPLKALASKCEASLGKEGAANANVAYSDLVIGLRQMGDERRQGELKECPHQRSAEQCRAKLKPIIARIKPRSQNYRNNLSDELGQLSVDMVDAFSQPPRLPASSR